MVFVVHLCVHPSIVSRVPLFNAYFYLLSYGNRLMLGFVREILRAVRCRDNPGLLFELRRTSVEW